MVLVRDSDADPTRVDETPTVSKTFLFRHTPRNLLSEFRSAVQDESVEGVIGAP